MKLLVPVSINIAILLIVGLLYFHFVFKHSQELIETKIEEEFVSEMKMKAVLFENTIARYIQGTKSMSSRSMIRKKIVEYYNGNINYTELKDFTTPKYIDGTKALDDMVLARRYVNNRLLVQHDKCTYAGIEQVIADTTKQQLTAGFLINDTASLTYVVSPIPDNGQIIGYDILCYNNQHILQEIAQPDIAFELITDVKNDSLLNYEEKLLHSPEKVSYRIKSKYANAFFQFSIAHDLLFVDLISFYKTQLTVFFLLILGIALILFIIHRRTKLLALKKSTYLEALVAEKTSELEKKVNELRVVNQNLEESKIRLRTMFENNGVPALVINPDNQQIEDANEAAATFYGYEIEELKTMKIADFNQLPQTKVKTLIDDTLKIRKKYLQTTHTLKNGEVCDVEIYSSAIVLNGQTKLFSIIHDITERKKTREKIQNLNAELSNTIEELNTTNEELNAVNEELNRVNQAINEERKQFRSILDSIPEMVYVSDFETHKILFANKKLKELIGRDITGELCYEVIQNKTSVCDFCPDKHIRHTNTPYFWEFNNPVLKKHFYIMDRKIQWSGPKEVRFQLATDMTAQYKAEQELRKNEAKYRRLFDNSENLIMEVDATTYQVKSCNPKMAARFGTTPDKIEGRNLKELLPPNVFELREQHGLQAIHENKTIEFEDYHAGYYFYNTITPLVDDGKQTALIVALDITGRKKAELALKANEWLLNQVGEMAKIGGWKINLSTQELTWTTEVFRIHEKEDFTQPTVEEAIAFYDEKSLPVIQKAVAKAMQDGTPFDMELTIKTAKDNKKFVRAMGRLQNGTHNNEKHLIGVFQDITDPKEKERKIQEISDKYKQLFDFMPVGISLADNNGQLLENNKVAQRLLGMSEAEHNQRTIDAEQWKIIRKDGTVMPPDEFASVKALKEKRLIENQEMGLWKGPETTTWINVSAVPSVSNDGVIISYIDISEKVKRETQLLQYTQQLKEANTTKDRFISILAHDLKSPFNSLLGLSDMLIRKIDKYDKEKVKTFAKGINNVSKQTFDLLNNLLEWSRSQRNKIPFNPQKFSINALVKDVVSLMQPSADLKQIALKTTISEKRIEAQFDPEMIKTVIRNLLGNAIKFTPNEGTITISAASGQHQITVSVADTGRGMNETTKNSLFKIGETKSRPGTQGEKGTGFGLLLCKEFIDKHNGTITVESEEGKGSTFSFTLPN